MTIFHKLNLDEFTGSVPIRLASGSKDSDSELSLATRQSKLTTSNLSPNGQADNRELTSMSGMPKRLPTCSMGCIIQEPFTIRTNGSVGQEILDADGVVIAWTTDLWVAQVICKLMTENEGLLGYPLKVNLNTIRKGTTPTRITSGSGGR